MTSREELIERLRGVRREASLNADEVATIDQAIAVFEEQQKPSAVETIKAMPIEAIREELRRRREPQAEPNDAPTVQFNARKGGKSQALIESMIAQANERGIRVEVVYPQAEPSDEQVRSALSAWFQRMIAGGWDNTHEERMRAALSAAFKAGGEER